VVFLHLLIGKRLIFGGRGNKVGNWGGCRPLPTRMAVNLRWERVFGCRNNYIYTCEYFARSECHRGFTKLDHYKQYSFFNFLWFVMDKQ
jgi:hypothetical protein